MRINLRPFIQPPNFLILHLKKIKKRENFRFWFINQQQERHVN